MRRAVGAGTALLTVLTTTAGCYRYAPVNGVGPDRGTEVRVRLTDGGAVALAPLIGNRVESVDGRVSAVGDTSLVLAVRMTTDRTGIELPWQGEPVTIPRSAVAGVETRTFDRNRTLLVTGGALAAVVLIGVGFSLAGFGGGSEGGPSGTPR
jgi:hypothetical protein